MIKYISLLLLLATLLIGTNAWARDPSPESLVVMAYISTLRCKAQHPKLRKGLDAAYLAWTKRNKKYVDSAHKMIDFTGIDNQYKTLKKRDKRIPIKTCQVFIQRLHDPANDANKAIKKHH